ILLSTKPSPTLLAGPFQAAGDEFELLTQIQIKNVLDKDVI
ncbi:26866_t:CDS:1, partial [Racocetra persica]